MKIIGHRGAAGTELENTLASLQAAVDFGVDGIELDVRRTKDNHLIVCHDQNLMRTAENDRKINELTLLQLQKIPLLSAANIPTLAEALEVIGEVPVYIEIKESGCAELLMSVINDFPLARITVVSFKHDELALLKILAPDMIIYGSERTNPFDIIHTAKKLRLDGIALNYWLLNPLTYFLCKRAGLAIMVYTVNNRFQAAFISKLYPNIALCSDYPERFIRKRLSGRKKAC